MTERTVDPATLAVISGWLQQIVDEVDEVLCGSAFSPVISEGHDSASCLFTETGKLVCQGQKGLPIFIATMQDALEVMRLLDILQRPIAVPTQEEEDGGTETPFKPMIDEIPEHS